MKDKDKYFVETENLAFPEIHTGKVKQISSEKPNADESVIYDTVAVPEIHIKKKKFLKWFLLVVAGVIYQ